MTGSYRAARQRRGRGCRPPSVDFVAVTATNSTVEARESAAGPCESATGAVGAGHRGGPSPRLPENRPSREWSAMVRARIAGSGANCPPFPRCAVKPSPSARTTRAHPARPPPTIDDETASLWRPGSRLRRPLGAHGRLSRGDARHRNAVGRARDVVDARMVEEVDGVGIAAVLATDAEGDLGVGLAPQPRAHAQHLPDPGLVDGLER